MKTTPVGPRGLATIIRDATAVIEAIERGDDTALVSTHNCLTWNLLLRLALECQEARLAGYSPQGVGLSVRERGVLNGDYDVDEFWDT